MAPASIRLPHPLVPKPQERSRDHDPGGSGAHGPPRKTPERYAGRDQRESGKFREKYTREEIKRWNTELMFRCSFWLPNSWHIKTLGRQRELNGNNRSSGAAHSETADWHPNDAKRYRLISVAVGRRDSGSHFAQNSVQNRSLRPNWMRRESPVPLTAFPAFTGAVERPKLAAMKGSPLAGP